MHLLIVVVYIGTISIVNPCFTTAILPLILGTFLIDIIDHPVFVYITNRSQETSIQIRKLIYSANIIKAFRFWSDNHKKENRLLIHSILGQPILVLILFYLSINRSILFLFFLTLGMFLHILVDQAFDIKEIKHLKHWFFWPIEKKVNNITLIIYYFLMILTLTLLSIYMILNKTV